MIRSFPTTLPTSRFSVVAFAVARAATLSCAPVAGVAQTPAPAAPSPAAAADAGAFAAPANFDARHKVLNQRTAENDYRYA
ncbi:colicin transporter, partial [Burkholderia pseudomallei]